MRLPGGWEWIIVLVIVLLVFGVGRLSRIGSELGSAIRNFREGLGTKDDPDAKKDEATAAKAVVEEEKK
jgi:sec-independent protein translocase protein TatA